MCLRFATQAEIAGERCVPLSLFMDPLQNLWDLYESQSVSNKPQLSTDPTATMGSPNEGNFDHPVIKTRQQVDDARVGGMSPGEAHEEGHGEVNLSDVTMKSDLAATFGRVQDDGNAGNVRIEFDTKTPSMLAIDAKLEKEVVRNADSMKTKIPSETPVTPGQPTSADTPLETQEEFDYNFDVQYLQKYGRA